MNNQKNTGRIKTMGRLDIPTLYADSLALTVRTEQETNEKKYILSWLQNIGKFNVEQARIMVNESHMRRIIKLLCEQTNYYPEK